MFLRNTVENLESVLSDNPVVLLIEARQAGKSILVQSLKNESYQPNYITFDDPTVLAAAGSNPTAFLDIYRTQTDTEVDVLMEISGGEVVGTEIKSSASIGADAFKGLRVLEEDLGKKFKRGIVLYAGGKSVAFGEKMFALPLHSLWLLYTSRKKCLNDFSAKF